MNEIKILERQITHYRKHYFDGKPKISDNKFDKLIDELRELNPNSKILKQVGSPVKRTKFNLPFILGSLDKVKIDNAYKWMKQQNDDILVSWKIDGVSLFVEWDKGKLKTLATRGDGNIGEDITFKANNISGLPNNIHSKNRICARAEAVIKETTELPVKYKNRRNACSGIINRDDLDYLDLIHVVFHELIFCETLSTYELKRLVFLENLKLEVIPYFIINKKSINKDLIEETNQSVLNFLIDIIENKAKYEYKIDGLVLTKNTSKRENETIPKNKIAFKTASESEKTTVTHIEWNITRSGRIVPVVHVDAVSIDGTEINHPTGHNFDWIKKNKIGKGAVIELTRSGDVIPYIKSILTPAKKLTFPSECSACENPLSNEGVDLICTNPKCPGIRVAMFEHYIKTLGAENIAYATLFKMYKAKLIKQISDLYELKKENLEKIDGLGGKSADTIMQEISNTLKTTEDKLLASFGIPLVGIKIANKIVTHERYRGRFKSLFIDPENILYDKIITIEGIGPNIATSFVEDIQLYRELYEYLISKGLKFQKQNITNKLNGKSFQFTGSMNKSREEMEMLVMNNGGRLVSVSKKLDYLVIADVNSASTKAMKARELGIKLINENKFLKMLEK